MMSATEERASRATAPRHPGRLWVGVLVGPVAFMVQLVGDWVMGEVVACAPATRDQGTILGISVNAMAAIVDAALLGATIAAGILSWRQLHAMRHSERSDASVWLARAGVLTSILFGLLIATSFVPITLIEGCR